MYTQVASKLFIGSGSTQVSQAIPMEGYNTARAEFTVFAGTLDGIDIEESNDLENWTTLHSVLGPFGSPTYAIPVSTTCNAAFVLVRWITVDPEAAIVAGVVNLSSQ